MKLYIRKKSPYPKSFNPAYTRNVENKINKILLNYDSPILEIVKPDKLQELLDTKASMFSKPWYGQLELSADISIFIYDKYLA